MTSCRTLTKHIGENKWVIADFCETLQLDRQFDVSWLVDLDLTPTWIKEYAVNVGTQSSSLHPQKDTE